MTSFRPNAALWVLVCLLAPLAGGWRDLIGYATLQSRLGDHTPTGAGIGATQVEGDEGGIAPLGKYLPDRADPEFAGKTINDRSGFGQASLHATLVGKYFYGRTSSIAPGIDPVDSFDADHWIGPGMLRTLSPAPPDTETRRVQNHSWIGELPTEADTAEALRRLDLLIDRDGVVVCVGVNNFNPRNPRTRDMPPLLASAYNALAVGLSNGNASFGPTLIDSPGRVKPDLVAAANPMLTSYTTPVAASAAALLLEVMEQEGALSFLPAEARRTAEALLTKALLMGGADKAALPDWRRGFAAPATDGRVPLDYRYGAGMLNIDMSHRILTAGRREASTGQRLPTVGWNVEDIVAGRTRAYLFQVPPGMAAPELSILVTWNREVRFNAHEGRGSDFDLDGDVDAADLGRLRRCMAGTGVAPEAEGCDSADLDTDGDVDQSDFGVFQACLSGLGQPAAPDCLNWTSTSLADIDLYLYQVDGSQSGRLIDRSISGVDNVEHLHVKNVPAGTYVIMLRADKAARYAITWHAPLADAPASP